jgi:hypothetical protein
MSRNYDLNKLISFAQTEGVSLQINYWESDDTLEVKINSISKAEEFYQKRVFDIDSFILDWHKNLKEKLGIK